MRIEKLEELSSYLEELKVIKKVLQSNETKFISGEVYKCVLNNGRVITREKLIKGGVDGSASIVVPVTKEGEILTVIEPRVNTKGGVSVGFPAGYIDYNESACDAAKRELLEETGYSFEEMIHLDSFYQDEGVSSAYNSIFLALGCEKVSTQHLDADEIIKFMTFTYEEIEELESRGLINSANTKLALCKVRERRNLYGIL